MSTTTLITLLSGLLLILIPLLLSYLVFPDTKTPMNPSKKKKSALPIIPATTPLTFEEISDILAHSQSTQDMLKEAIEQLIKNHGKIHAKLGDIPHPDYKRYLALIINLCKNPQADKDIIISLDQKLRTKNPRYGLDIDEAVNKGIAARGF